MILHAPDSAYAQEMTKWEAQRSDLGPGLRPYVKREWPSRVYRAAQIPTGGLAIVDEDEATSETDFTSRFHSRGFRVTPLEALDYLRAQQTEAATLAAERGYEKQHKLSPQARAEVEALEEDAGANHLAMIPETPHGLRGVPVPTDREVALQAELDALKASLTMTQTVPRRGRPKKSETKET